MRIEIGLLIIAAILLIWYWSRPIIKVVTLDSGRPGPTLGLVGSVHGNEPAGAAALSAMKYELMPTRGKVVAILEANPLGLAAGTRMSPTGDINRHFVGASAGSCQYSRAILSALAPCTHVIDLHEGWGWHKITPDSVGATIAPTSAWPTALISPILSAVNATEPNSTRQFTARLGASLDIAGTLAGYCEAADRAYLLVETAGQNDIQPIGLRVAQARAVILSAMAGLNMTDPMQ